MSSQIIDFDDPARFAQPSRAGDVSFLPIITLVIWVGCLIVGAIGIWAEIHWVIFIPAPPQPLTLDVQIKTDSSPDQSPAPTETPQDQTQSPAPPPIPSLPPPPPPEALAEPMEMPLFPIKPTTTLSAPSQPASPPVATVQPPSPPQSSASQVHQLVFGQGEGDQPAPVYPHEAVTGRQQGVVVVRFDVTSDGHPVNVVAISPSPWPLLNQSATRAIRETWQFPTGPPRTYEVSIRFELR